MPTVYLTPKQRRILEYLDTVGDWVSRKEMKNATGPKNFSKALGAASRQIQSDSLEARGLVERRDLHKPFVYRITDGGRKELSIHAGADNTARRPSRLNVESVDLDDEQLEKAIQSAMLYFPSTVETGDMTAVIRQRRGQAALRRLTIRNYECRCAVCDVADERLLRASHVIPWSEREETRGELKNIICLCTFHDVLFEHGFWSLDGRLKPILRAGATSATVRALLSGSLAFRKPRTYAPNTAYLEHHRVRHAVA